MVKLTEQNREEYELAVVRTLQDEDLESFRELFFDLHIMDQLDIYINIGKDQRKILYHFISPEEFAEIFEELEFEQQKLYMKELSTDYARDVINNMSDDDIADFLGEMDESESNKIIETLDKEDQADIKELLSYEEETAGGIMTKEFISLHANDRIEDVINLLREEGPDAETIYYLYVANEKDQLVGVVSLRDLITADAHRKVEEVMSTRVLSVKTSDDQEDVARLFQKYDFLAVPVITDDGLLVGIITFDDILDVIEEEASEDLDEFAASRGSTDMKITPFAAAKLRAPWIILLMFIGMVSANIIGQFEETLEAAVLLAGFIPMIMGSAGNAGTQSLAVAVRSIAVGTSEKKGLGKLVFRELSTGFLLGIICAVVLIIIIPIMYSGNFMLAVVVGTSLTLSLTLATIIGTLIPMFIHKLNLDPAIASGPFITTINDIVGLLIYFSVATSLLAYL
ncbi:magnesium transporter [Salisediminibacterium selenitireducens]|uniref:Magnesium transporter MgtE n=1 Tax=Bacillus selenitireducens (strain ATCC 700615 / DSM 15326 / MLS10) TaxID=439292 RepID=D6XXH4_BACIE|nr:magnesium transporter [Salisediminibacterium selenitireducens]ADH98031.1 magnesium transporter [[Bacillus] selenitireducens MLS10]